MTGRRATAFEFLADIGEAVVLPRKQTVSPEYGPRDPDLISYQNLRQAIGYIGIALPLVVAIGKSVSQGGGLEDSISAYYYTDMRDWFVGSLCAIAVFLMCYRGYEKRDLIAGRLACVFAIGVAFFPTTPLTNPTPPEELVGRMHLTCAMLFFGTLAYFSWFLFTETDPTKTPTPRKLRRNWVYRFCAVMIVSCIVLIGIVRSTPLGKLLAGIDPVFWLEAGAIFFFGISWLTKGERFLKDN